MSTFQWLSMIRERILVCRIKRMRKMPFFTALVSVADNFSEASCKQIIALRNKLLHVNSRIGNVSFVIADMAEILSSENHRISELLSISDDDLAELILSYNYWL